MANSAQLVALAAEAAEFANGCRRFQQSMARAAAKARHNEQNADITACARAPSDSAERRFAEETLEHRISIAASNADALRDNLARASLTAEFPALVAQLADAEARIATAEQRTAAAHKTRVEGMDAFEDLLAPTMTQAEVAEDVPCKGASGHYTVRVRFVPEAVTDAGLAEWIEGITDSPWNVTGRSLAGHREVEVHFAEAADAARAAAAMNGCVLIPGRAPTVAGFA